MLKLLLLRQYNDTVKRCKAQETPTGISEGILNLPLSVQAVLEFDLRSIYKTWKLFPYIEAFWSGPELLLELNTVFIISHFQ